MWICHTYAHIHTCTHTHTCTFYRFLWQTHSCGWHVHSHSSYDWFIRVTFLINVRCTSVCFRLHNPVMCITRPTHTYTRTHTHTYNRHTHTHTHTHIHALTHTHSHACATCMCMCAWHDSHVHVCGMTRSHVYVCDMTHSYEYGLQCLYRVLSACMYASHVHKFQHVMESSTKGDPFHLRGGYD